MMRVLYYTAVYDTPVNLGNWAGDSYPLNIYIYILLLAVVAPPPDTTATQDPGFESCGEHFQFLECVVLLYNRTWYY